MDANENIVERLKQWMEELMVHGARVKVDAECFKGNGSNLECEYTENDLIFLNY